MRLRPEIALVCIATAGIAAAVGLFSVRACYAEESIEPLEFADARLLGMGYSYVGLSSVPNPLYSNPASFGFTKGMLSLSFGVGFGGSGGDGSFKYLAATDEEREGGTGGFAWAQYKRLDGGLELTNNSYNYAVGKAFKDTGSLGIGFRYLRGAEHSGHTLLSSWQGFATDIGVMLRYKAITLGVLARDVTTTDLKSTDGAVRAVPPTYSLGLSLTPRKGAVVALAVHNVSVRDHATTGTVSGGFEGRIGSYIALRGGVILKDGFEGGVTAYTGGLGYFLGDIELGYACLVSDEQIKKQCISIMKRF